MENRKAGIVTREQVKAFLNEWNSKKASATLYSEYLKLFRHVFFKHFYLSDKVPANLVKFFVDVARAFYDKRSTGYNGIMKEISDRAELYMLNEETIEIREFLLHRANQSDFYDSYNRVSYEKKTGCGDWLRSEKSSTFEEIIDEYKRKKTLIRWDYDFIPSSESMNGKKSVNKNFSELEKQVKQESTKHKKDGTPIVNKQYEIHIHIETTYKKLFEYMESYPSGLKTFFKESIRSGRAGVFCWELQTLKNSKKKIAFLQACPYNTAKSEEEED